MQATHSIAEEVFQEFREDLLCLHELFLRFDYDRTGYLDVLEVTFMLKDFGLLPRMEKERNTVFSIMEACDENGNGEFDFGEFLGLVHQIREYAMGRCKDELLYTFERYDRDCSGELSIGELSGLLCGLGLVPHTRREQEELAQLIHLVDTDGSGLIDYKELQVLCQRIKENMIRLRYESEVVKARAMGFEDGEIHDLRFAFDRLDTSFNGRIDKNEAKVCVQMTKIPCTLEAFDESFKQLDLDRSGELEFLEFAELMRLLREREGLFLKEDRLSWSG